MKKFKYIVYGGYKKAKWVCWLDEDAIRNVGTKKECEKGVCGLQYQYFKYNYGIAPVVIYSRK